MTEQKRRGRPPKARLLEAPVEQTGESAQSYALRVWRGQSPDAPKTWRMERVRLALEGQGMSMEGVTLP